jgi:hypothetical protein
MVAANQKTFPLVTVPLVTGHWGRFSRVYIYLMPRRFSSLFLVFYSFPCRLVVCNHFLHWLWFDFACWKCWNAALRSELRLSGVQFEKCYLRERGKATSKTSLFSHWVWCGHLFQVMIAYSRFIFKEFRNILNVLFLNCC